MNAGRDVERLLSDWLVEEAPSGAPDRIVLGARDRLDHTMQRRFRVAWRFPSMNAPLRVAAAAVIGLLLLGGAYFLTRSIVNVVGQPTPVVSPTPSPSSRLGNLTWSPERATQDWPGPVRPEPAGGAPVTFVVPRGARAGEGVVRRDPAGDSFPGGLSVVDIGTVRIREGCWSSMTTEACVSFDPETRPVTQLDPRSRWVAYGIVVDNTGDGQPDLRFGIDNASSDGGLRMWQADIATGAIELDDSLESAIMDADYPGADTEGHIFVRQPGPVFRFYVWASAIEDGRIVATDYAPDIGWIDFQREGGDATDLAQAVPLGALDGLLGAGALRKCDVLGAGGSVARACTWTSSDGATVVVVEVNSDDGTVDAFRSRAATLGLAQTIAGLGEAAGAGPYPAGGRRVGAFANGVTVWVTIRRDGDAASLVDAATEIARSVLAARVGQTR